MSAPFAPDDIFFSLALAPDTRPHQRGVCLAACASGLYRSTDGGRTWVEDTARLALSAALPVTAVAAAPQDGAQGTAHHLFAGVGPNVFRSTDGGETWRGVFIAQPLPTVSSLLLSPDYARDATLYAATVEDGVFQSQDGGARWQPVNFGLLDLNVYCLSAQVGDQPLLLAGVESGLFRSKNNARAWREVPLPDGYDPVLSLACAPTQAYAGTETHGLFASADRGQTWQQMADPNLPSGAVIALLPLAHEDLAALFDSGLFVRDPAGVWQPWTAAVDTANASAAALSPQGSAALIGWPGGELRWVEREG